MAALTKRGVESLDEPFLLP